MKRRQNGEILSPAAKTCRMIWTVILIIYTFITVFVIAMTLMDSLKTKGDLVSNFVGIPKAVSFESYKKILLEDNFLLYFKNSFILTFCGTAGAILLAALTAYGIARYQFKGKSFLTAYFLIGMMVPVQVSILPLFLILKKIGLINKLPGMILVYMAGISMACFIFQKFFRTISVELEESARLDGAGDFRIFFRIIMPVSKPVIVTMALITAIQEWNDFYMPMVLLGSKNTRTLTLSVYQYMGQFMKYMGESMAAVIITLIPIIILYFVFSIITLSSLLINFLS